MDSIDVQISLEVVGNWGTKISIWCLCDMFENSNHVEIIRMITSLVDCIRTKNTPFKFDDSGRYSYQLYLEKNSEYSFQILEPYYDIAIPDPYAMIERVFLYLTQETRNPNYVEPVTGSRTKVALRQKPETPVYALSEE